MKVEVDKDKYIEQWTDNLPKSYLDIDLGETWEIYHSNLYPYLDLINDEMNRVDKPTEEQVMMAFYVPSNNWSVIKKTFTGINQALCGKRIGMRLQAQIALIKGNELSPSSGKIIETMLTRYDSDYKPKGAETTIEVPKTLEVNIINAKLSDEERKEKAHVKKE